MTERLLERDDALARLHAALSGVPDGAGRVVVVAGEAGVGKTTLVRRFVEAVPDAFRVLRGACDDLVVPEPLAPIRDIAEQTGGALARLVEGGDGRAVGRALRDALAAAAPCICVIEDVHWADEATLDAVAHVSRRLAGARCMLILTFRDDEPGGNDRVRTMLGAIPAEDVVRIALEPLSSAAVAELAGEEVDAGALFAATAGNPFLVGEALAAGGGHGVPATVQDAVLGRAARLGAAARDLLELVAVVPSRAELWLVEAHAGEAAAGLGECERSGLLTLDGDAVHFRHELARRALGESLPALRRRDLHRAVLRILEGRGADPARLVHHAEASQDAEALARHAPAAAERAAAARSHREAVAFYERALAEPELLEPAQRAAAFEGLSTAAYTEGRAELALGARRSALALWRTLGDREAVGTNLRWLARLYWWSGRRSQAEAAAGEAIAVLEPLGASRALAMAYSARSQLAMLAQLTDEAIAFGERAMALSRELGDSETLVHTQTNVGSATMLEDADRGRSLLEQAGEIALAEGLDEHACRAFHNMAAIDHDQRRLELARAEVERALDVARRTEQRWFEVDTRVLRAVLDVTTGRWQAAAGAVEELLGDAEPPGVTLAPATWVLAVAELRAGGAQAQRLVSEAWELAQAIDELQWLRPAACLRAEAAWLAGDPAAVDVATSGVYATALERGHPWDVGELALWRRRAGLLDEDPPGCAAPYAASIAGDWEAAARAWEELGVPYEQALALCDANVAEPVLAGLELLDRLGAAAPARVVRRKLTSLGVRSVPRGPRPSTRSHPAGLSARQAEVLGLLANGCSNATIAKTLFLTPKTVEHHVTAILRKLRVDSRAAAVEVAREAGLVGAQDGGAATPS